MRVVIAPDSFKDACTAIQAAEAMSRGVHRADATADVHLLPIADGGEGTVDCLLSAAGGDKVWVDVSDPLGRPTRAAYGVLPDGTAVIEMAAAAGVGLVSEAERDVMRGNTVGVGQLVAHALDHGVSSLVVGLGGSATNDAGMGMLYGLGVRFYDADGGELAPTPAAAANLMRVDVSRLHPALAKAHLRVACDVTNPLCGPEGATAVYGPQKGVAPDLVPLLDGILARFAMVIAKDLGVRIDEIPGGGAAGGLGAAFAGVLGAELVPGIDLVLELSRFSSRVRDADLVLCGEGRTDGQTLRGKAVMGVARLAQAYGVPVFCLSGAVTPEATNLYRHGVTGLFSIAHGPMSLTEAMAGTTDLLERTAESVVRTFLAGRGGALDSRAGGV